MKKILVFLLLAMGVLQILAGVGLITFTQQFLLYVGGGLLALALFLFLTK